MKDLSICPFMYCFATSVTAVGRRKGPFSEASEYGHCSNGIFKLHKTDFQYSPIRGISSTSINALNERLDLPNAPEIPK